MKRYKMFGIIAGTVLATAVIAYAITSLIFTQTQTSSFSKKTIFQFDLSTGLKSAEIGPGDSFTINPTVYNDSTEEMYVFIVIDQPTCNEESIYTYEIGNGWVSINSTVAKQIYAYAGDEMIALQPGDTTEELTTQMTMRNISNADYSKIDDINVIITAYAIGTEDVSTNPSEAWEQCKAIGGID